jgi:hypothetical protein
MNTIVATGVDYLLYIALTGVVSLIVYLAGAAIRMCVRYLVIEMVSRLIPARRITGASDFLSPFDSFHQLQIS